MRPSRRPRRLKITAPAGAAGALGGGPADAAASPAAMEQEQRYVSELRKILGRFGARRRVAAGASLFDPSDFSRHLYIVESGTIDVSLPEDPQRRPIASFHAGASFLFDFGAHHIAVLEAAGESVVIDVPYARLRRLCRHEMELRLLLRQSHAFDIKSFLDVCYPTRSRIRLANETGRERTAESAAARQDGDDRDLARRSPHPDGGEAAAPAGAGRARPGRRRPRPRGAGKGHAEEDD